MTYEEIADAALARVSELPGGVSDNRTLLYRRIGQRQHELFAHAAQVAPDYFGVCVTGVLDHANGSGCDLWAIAEAAQTVERVVRVTISDPGSSAYAAGEEVHIVPFTDPGTEFPPRMTLRDGALRAVGSDLQGVASVQVSYARTSAEVRPTHGELPAELPPEWQELLVIDAARDLLRRALSPATEVKAALQGMLEEEEKELLARYEAHLTHYAPTAARF